MSKSDMGSINHILVIGNYYVNHQNYQNLMLLTSSDTKRTLMHLLLFTAQREMVAICTQSIHNHNWLSLHYILVTGNLSRYEPNEDLRSTDLEGSEKRLYPDSGIIIKPGGEANISSQSKRMLRDCSLIHITM